MTASYVAAGDGIAARAQAWASEMHSLVSDLVSDGRATVGLERLNAGAALALASTGLTRPTACSPPRRYQAGNHRERAVGDNAPRHVIAGNGDYCETRLMSSGPRTNPWFQEASSRVIQANELVALDTDVVASHGYYADFSRTFHVGPDRPTAEQRELYRLAHEQVHHNMATIEPGLTFADYATRAWNIPERYHADRYYLSAHGVGMTGEYRYLYHDGDFDAAGYDGEIVPNMTLCVESDIGAEGGGQRVKLEQQLLVTETGTELLSKFPFEDDLL